MMSKQPGFIPLTVKDAEMQGIDRFDIIFVTGDAYVDHPSFAAALLSRVLWDAGFSVAIISRPEWKKNDDFTRFGKPALFFAVSSGNVDSMVNNYTANLKRRSEDVYAPGGELKRPDRACTVYTDRLHALFPDVPIVIGGIEASLRRFAHYDYWSDRVRQSILADAPADILVFGMGERQMTDLARRTKMGEKPRDIRDISGTMHRVSVKEWRNADKEGYVEIPDFSSVSADKTAYASAFAMHYQEQDPFRGRPVAQAHPKTVVIQNPPAKPLRTEELDHIYELPFTRKAHPSYQKPVPALAPVQFSVTTHRGCFGGCAFCALTHHQGRIIQSRSEASIEREVRTLSGMPDFRGIIHDIGGPTANMWGAHCSRWEGTGTCPDRQCTADCPGMHLSHEDQLRLLRKLRKIPGVKWVFIGSGIRYDLFLDDPAQYLEELCSYHVSGHLKVAPEHISAHVTALMNKPGREPFERFRKKFEKIQENKKKRQYIVPYFMSGHPGCTIADMIELAEYIRDNHLYTEQVQDFTPTPMSVSTCMYYTGINPFTMEQVHVPKGHEKRIQRAILHYRDPKNQDLVEEGLKIAGRSDLIGNGPGCLAARKFFGIKQEPKKRAPR